MQTYENKEDLTAAMKKAAQLFIGEFDTIKGADKDKLIDGVDRTPAQMIAYQLGWMNLIMKWDKDELEGKEVKTPSQEYKWNNLGALYKSFYKEYGNYSLPELRKFFSDCLEQMLTWVNNFSNQELFAQDVRKWASLTPAKWPVWKWVHINTVAPFKSFRTKIRKWKRLNAQAQY